MTAFNARWEGDRIGHGIGDGTWIAPSVQDLLDTLSESTWIAEDPAAHLLPHLQGAIDEAGSPWSLLSADLHDVIYVLELGWNRSGGRMRDLRADAIALLGEVAESATYIHQRVEGETIIYDVVTGMLPGESRFAAHGHALQFRIGGESVGRILAGMLEFPRDVLST